VFSQLRPHPHPHSRIQSNLIHVSLYHLKSDLNMCIERLRRHSWCIANVVHGYWELDFCILAINRGGIPCEVVEKEPPKLLPAPYGVEPCPYAGCSSDPRYQWEDSGITATGRKGWAKGGKTSPPK